MTDPRYQDTKSDDAGDARDGPSFAAAPRWVKVSAAVVVVLVLLFAVLRLTGRGGEHGPGRHAPSGTPPTDRSGGHAPPVDGHARP